MSLTPKLMTELHGHFIHLEPGDGTRYEFQITYHPTRLGNVIIAAGVDGAKITFLIGAKDDILNKSSRNIPKLNLEMAENANTYDVMNSDVLLLTKSAVDKVKNVLLGS